MSSNQKGFTIVELMIATSVFAVVLIICTVAMLQIGRTYYKGITSTRTQETAREILDEVAKTVQFGSGQPEPLTGGGNQGYCIGNKRYSYALDWQVVDSPNTAQNQSRHALVADELPCDGIAPLDVAPSPPANPITAAGVGDNPRELINTRMRLAIFRICRPGDIATCPTDAPPAGSNLYKITVRVVSGDNGLLNDRNGDSQITPADNPIECRSQQAGGQFCAVSELSTVVQKRVN